MKKSLIAHLLVFSLFVTLLILLALPPVRLLQSFILHTLRFKDNWMQPLVFLLTASWCARWLAIKVEIVPRSIEKILLQLIVGIVAALAVAFWQRNSGHHFRLLGLGTETLVFAAVSALSEELLLRGVLLVYLAPFYNFKRMELNLSLAAFSTSFLFGFGKGLTPILAGIGIFDFHFFLQAFSSSLFFSLLFIPFRSLLPGFLTHTGLNLIR